MREILFRAKDAITGEWLEGYFVQQKNNVGGIHSCIFQNFPDENKWEMKRIDLTTVCQYTGLTDKNGRKIFEGDIVKAIYKPKDEDLTIDDFIIKWDKYYCKFVGYYTNKENVYNPLLFGSQTSFEVIGNIFDNPELIGE